MKDLVDKLQNIGISRREAEVYIALLQKKEFTAPELAKLTTITRTKIYEILQNLVRKGVCNENYRDGQKVFRGIKPQIAIQNIVSNYSLEIEQKKQAAISLETELASLHKNNLNNNDPLDYIEVITDLGQIRNKWNELQSNSKFEMLVFSKSPYSAGLEENIKDETAVINKGIKCKGIYEYADIESDGDMDQFLSMLSSYISAGEEIRLIESLPIKLAIIDEKIAMLALNDPVSLKPSITTMVVNHPNFALAQKEVFESYWNKSISIEDFKKLKTI